MITAHTLLSLHAESIHTATTYVSQVRERDVGRPTPCAEWDLAALLAHMVGQHRGFALAAHNGWAPKSAYRPERFTHGRWLDSAFGLLGAFAEANPDDGIIEVELHPTRLLPFSTVVGAQLLDTVVHTWDVARSIDMRYTPTEEIAEEVLRVAETVPNTAARKQPGAAFAPAVTFTPATDSTRTGPTDTSETRSGPTSIAPANVSTPTSLAPADASTWERALALLGRDPHL